MKILTFTEARGRGFEPSTYSQYPPIGIIHAKIDFMAWITVVQALYFRQHETNVRYFLTMHSSPSPDGMSMHSLNAFLQYLQQGDLCELLIYQTTTGGYILKSAEIIAQAPDCKWRNTCDKSSPCCALRN